jgi:hypothetical protein
MRQIEQLFYERFDAPSKIQLFAAVSENQVFVSDSASLYLLECLDRATAAPVSSPHGLSLSIIADQDWKMHDVVLHPSMHSIFAIALLRGFMLATVFLVNDRPRLAVHRCSALASNRTSGGWATDLPSQPTSLYVSVDHILVSCIDGKVYRYRLTSDGEPLVFSADEPLIPTESALSICITPEYTVFGCQNGMLDLQFTDSQLNANGESATRRKRLLCNGPVVFLLPVHENKHLLIATAFSGLIVAKHVLEKNVAVDKLEQSDGFDVATSFAYDRPSGRLWVGYYSGVLVEYELSISDNGVQGTLQQKISVREPVYSLAVVHGRLFVHSMYGIHIYNVGQSDTDSRHAHHGTLLS